MDSIDATIQYKSHNPMCPVVAPKFNNLKCSQQDFFLFREIPIVIIIHRPCNRSYIFLFQQQPTHNANQEKKCEHVPLS